MKEPFFDFSRIKKNRAYKFFDLFLNDNQKESACLDAFGIAMIVAMKVGFIRDRMPFLDENERQSLRLTKIVTDEYVLLLAHGAGYRHKHGDILFRKRGFLNTWNELDIPEDVIKLINKTTTKKELRKILNSVMKMKAFW